MRYLFKILIVIRGYIYQLFAGTKIRDKHNFLPKTVKNFKLVKDFQPEKNFPFKVGLYQGLKSETAVIKIWRGKFKDIHYFDLLHQKSSMEILDRVHTKSYKFLPKNLKNIRFPKIKFLYRENHKLELGSEFAVGTPISQLTDPRKQIEIYHQVTAYLHKLGEHCSGYERNQLRHKTIFDYLLLFPFLFIVAIIENPKDSLLIIELACVYLISSIGFLKPSKLTLVHGDLNFKNININKTNIFILDTEQLSFTYPEFELVTSLSTLSTPLHFKIYMINQINEFANSNLFNKLKIVFLMLNCELHNLTWNSPQENRLWYKKVINFALNIFWQGKASMTISRFENVYD